MLQRWLGQATSPTSSAAQPNAGPEGIRLSKLVRLSGVSSRHEAERLVRSGRVKVADEVATYGGMAVPPQDVGSVTIDGIKLTISPAKLRAPAASAAGASAYEAPARLWLYNKPRGELCSFVPDASKSRPIMGDRIYAQLPPQLRPAERRRAPGPGSDSAAAELAPSSAQLLPVERLEFLTEGLCLVTNNGAFARFLASSEAALRRVYRVRVNGKLTEEKLGGLRRGVIVAGGSGGSSSSSGGSGGSGGGGGGGTEPYAAASAGAAARPHRTLPLDVTVDAARRGVGGKSASNSWLTLASSEANKQRNLQTALAKLFIRPLRVISTGFGPFRLPVDDDTGRVLVPPGGLLEAKIPADLMARWVGRGYRAGAALGAKGGGAKDRGPGRDKGGR